MKINNSYESSRVHLLVSDLYQADAIGNFVVAIREMLIRRGFHTFLYAERFDNSILNVRSYSDFFAEAKTEDILIYQLSNFDPALQDIMAFPCRKVVYYHNITPGHFFAPYSKDTAEILDKGRSELRHVCSSDVLFANSRYSLAEVEPYLSKNGFKAVLPPFFPSQAESFLSDNEEIASSATCIQKTPYLLTLGRVVPHKNIENALHIFSFLTTMFPDLHLIIAGSHYEPYAEKLIAKVADSSDLVSRVTFTGKLKKHEVTELLRHATGLLHTSDHEGFCMPVFEAMLAKIPVFANNQEAVAETLNGTGVLFDAHQSALSAMKIKEYITNTELRERVISAQFKHAKQIMSYADEGILLSKVSSIVTL